MSYPGPGQDPYGEQNPGGFGNPNYPGGTGQPGYGAPGPAPDNNLVWAILSTLFCCLPLGIASIVKAASVNSLWAQGQFAQAQKASEDAKKFAIWGAIAGVVVIVVYVLFIFVVGAAGVSSGY